MTDFYLIVHKEDSTGTTCFFSASENVFEEVKVMMDDHGGSITVLELKAEVVAKKLLEDLIP